MKRTDIKLETKCRVNKSKESQVYIVAGWLDSHVVELDYITETGKRVSGGTMDISLLEKA